MGIFDGLLSRQPATPAPAQQQQPIVPGNLPPDAGVTDPNNPHIPPAPTEPESPLAQYEKLWETVPDDPNNPAPAAPIELKAEDVQKAMANTNFTKAITPEQLAAISQGGEAAQQAFADAMNTVAQQVMVQSTLVSNKLSEKAVETALEAERNKLPQLMREQASTAHLSEANPIFNNPAVKPIIDSTKAQLLSKFPNATPAEITQMTQDYILAMGEAFSPQTTDVTPGEQDWSNFLNNP